jgi:hypothetical protein
MLSDRTFYPLAALFAVALIALASVYPQGQGARSPRPFGHATWMETRPKKPPAAANAVAPADKAQLKGPL